MSTSQPPPLHRDFLFEGKIDPVWGQWLWDLRTAVDAMNTSASTGTGSIVRQTSPTLITPAIGAATGALLALTGDITTGNVAALHKTSVNLNNGAGAGAGTLLNAPAAGNPTKWVPIDDNGTLRYVPSW